MLIETSKVGALIDPTELQDWERLGHGGFGVVYRAMWQDRVIAVKVSKTAVKPANADQSVLSSQKSLYASLGAANEADMSPETLREWQILQSVRHAYIVQYIDAFVINNCFCLALEYADGGSLRGCLETLDGNGERLSLAQIHSYAIAIVSGLLYLHQNQIWHRDLKTDNILLVNNVPKISDFGLSRLEVSSKGSAISTESKTVLIGSFQWVAPEWFEESTDYAASDIYGMGNIFWSLLTNQAPFSGCTLGFVASSFNKGIRPPMPADGPPLIKSIINRCWRTNVKERPRLTSILAELEAVNELSFESPFHNQILHSQTQVPFQSTSSVNSMREDDFGVNQLNLGPPTSPVFSCPGSYESRNHYQSERNLHVKTPLSDLGSKQQINENDPFYSVLEKYGVSKDIQECFRQNSTSQDEFMHLSAEQLRHLFPSSNILQINKLLKIQEYFRAGKMKMLGASEQSLPAFVAPQKLDPSLEEKFFEGLQQLDKNLITEGLEKVKEAAERQVGLAQLKMAQFLFDGIGVKKDAVQSRSWLIRLAQNPFSELLTEADLTQTLENLTLHGMVQQESGNLERALSLYYYVYCTDNNYLASLLGIYTVFARCGTEIPRPRDISFESDIIGRINSAKDAAIQQTIEWLKVSKHEQTNAMRTTFLGFLLQVVRKPFGDLHGAMRILEPLTFRQKGGLASFFVAEHIYRIDLVNPNCSEDTENRMIANYQHAASLRIANAHSRLARLYLAEDLTKINSRAADAQIADARNEKGKTHLQHALAWFGSHVWTLYGDLHRLGITFEKDNQEIKLCYQKAATFGDPCAQLQLSQLPGVDKAEQFRLLTFASRQGDVDALAKLALFYRLGEGGAPRDVNESVRLLYQAAELEKNKTLYSKRNPSLVGIHELASCLWSGIGLNESKEQAIKFFTQSAEGGYVLSQIALADAYAVGSGVKKSQETAFKWLLMAAQNGNQMAQTRLSECYEKGIGVKKSAVMSQKWRDISLNPALYDKHAEQPASGKMDPLFGM